MKMGINFIDTARGYNQSGKINRTGLRINWEREFYLATKSPEGHIMVF